jgi:hypothetical protein
MLELCGLVNIHLSKIFEVLSLNINKIQENVRRDYAAGTPEEKELAPYIFIEFDAELYAVVVRIPSGVNSKGEKFLNVLVGREFGKYGKSPDVSILRYMR